jgi:hypothetical protein
MGCAMVRRLAAALGLAGVLSACAGGELGPTPGTFVTGSGVKIQVEETWTVEQVRVEVPGTLTVATDPDERFPNVDINWWEDPEGDRRQQVADIMKEAVAAAVATLSGPERVFVDVRVRKFHALTPDALENGTRGWHDVIFDLTVRDAQGNVLAEEKEIDADIRALQGQAAKDAYARGITQKSMIQQRVTNVVRAWFGLG